jgi:hypothetical protein
MITVDHPMRGVAFLISEDKRSTAKSGFDGLNKNTKNMFQTRFDYWLNNKPYGKGYHGWDKSQFGGKYTHCFVFTCREKRKAQRLYGFLCNPKPSDQRYRICVLIRHAAKTEHETDENELRIVEEMRNLPDVLKALDDYFEEEK